jgi:hypothetical protein
VKLEPAVRDRLIEADLVFGRRCRVIVDEGTVDLLDVDAAVLAGVNIRLAELDEGVFCTAHRRAASFECVTQTAPSS